ncbi:hypothetical protein BED65_15655 [Listeria monocytogenes]|nr:hypothetical protein [Listeria monocytogenes]
MCFLVSIDFINNEITDVSIFKDLDILETGRFACNHINDTSYFGHDISHDENSAKGLVSLGGFLPMSSAFLLRRKY